MNEVTMIYFTPLHDLVVDELDGKLSEECMNKLLSFIDRIEKRLILEIELREFVCEKFSKVVHDRKL